MRARENFHINFYNNWNVFYDDDFIIQIIKHATEIEVAFKDINIILDHGRRV